MAQPVRLTNSDNQDILTNGNLPVSNSALGTTTDAVASITNDETASAGTHIGIIKAIKNLVIDGVGYLATIAGAISGGKMLLGAGTSIIGKVGIDQTTPGATNKVDAGYTVVRSDTLFTGMDATSQYDAVGALVEIQNWARVAGGSATIREMRISVNNNAIAPQFEVHFFRNSDATVAADNASWTELAAEYPKRAGYIAFPVACAKSTGSGTIDMVRAQMDDYGQSLSKEITCAAGATSVWVKLKLLNSGISFAATPGNTIVLSTVREQS